MSILKKLFVFLSILVLPTMAFGGCATRSFVKEQVSLVTSETNQVRGRAIDNQKEIQGLKQDITVYNKELEQAKKEIREGRGMAQETQGVAEEARSLGLAKK